MTQGSVEDHACLRSQGTIAGSELTEWVMLGTWGAALHESHKPHLHLQPSLGRPYLGPQPVHLFRQALSLQQKLVLSAK